MGYDGVSYNPYPYAHNNPINLTDPSGRFPFSAIGLGMAAGAAIGAGMDMVAQVADNLANGRGAFDCYDPGSTLRAAAEGALMGGASALIGDGVGAFGGSSVFAGIVAEGANFAFGVGWDMMIYGDSFESAVVNNLLGVGIGFGIGAAASGAGRAWRGGVSLSRVTRMAGDTITNAFQRGMGSGIGRTVRNGLDSAANSRSGHATIDAFLAPAGSLPSANTPNTHSCTRRNGSFYSNRSIASTQPTFTQCFEVIGLVIFVTMFSMICCCYQSS